jgi:hypoxia up-regulated 1
MNNQNIFLILIIFSLLYTQIFSASGIAIDFGSEFITTSIIRSRKPIELVENPQGTKANQYLYMKDYEKIFGYNAKVKAIKSPEAVFHHLQEFLGKTKESPELKNYMKKYFQTYDIVTDEKSHHIKFKVNYNDQKYLFSTQELLGMMLRYIKDFSEKYGQTEIRDFVITVPCFYGYKQHQALVNAADISGMKLLRIIHDNTAVAIKYFNENRPQKEVKYYIFYNMGASYTQISLISVYATYEGTKKDMKENQYIKIIDEEYDIDLGGRNFDYKLAKLIYKKYKKKTYNVDLTKEDLDKIPQETITKILPYAVKYKEILSANKETVINVLGIEKNTEFEDLLTREEFLNECEEEFAKVYPPLEKLIKRNDLSIQQIMQIEFVGGCHRIPKVKEIIGKYIPENKIGVHLNGDDVVAFGAGIYTSNLLGMINSVNGVQKKVNLLNHGYVYNTKISIKNVEPTDKMPFCEESFNKIAYNCIKKISKSATIFPAFGNFTSEKSVSFDYDGDLDIDILQNNNTVMKFHLKRIKSDVLPELKSKNKYLLDEPKSIRIKLVFSMDKYGLMKMNAQIHYKVQSFYMYIEPKDKDGKMTFKYISNPSEDPKPLTQEQVHDLLKKLEDKKIYPKEEERNKLKKIINSGKVNNATKPETKIKYISLKNDESEEVYPIPMTREEIKNSKSVLAKIWNMDKQNLKYQEKKNSLENFIYTKYEWIKNKKLNERYAKEDELVTLKKDVDKLKEWFDNEGGKAKIDKIEDKLKEAKKAFKVFEERMEKEKKRNNSIKYFRSEVSSALKQSKNWIKEKPWIEKYYNTTFEPKIEELNKWIDEYEEKVNQVKEYEESIFDKKELSSRLEDLREESKKMRNIPRPIVKASEDL